MLETLVEKKEILTYIMYVGLILFAMDRAYGVANLLRFLFRRLNIGYSDRKMKNLDDKWFNVQLFKIINRINITKIEDARLIQKGLNEGSLKPSLFFLTSSWGDITIPMSPLRKTISILMIFVLIIFGTLAWYAQEPIIDGYAKIDYKQASFYISKDRLFITYKNGFDTYPTIRSKEDCRSALKVADQTSVLAIACTKLLDERESYQWWLDDEIKSIRDTKNDLAILAYSYLALGTISLLSLLQFLIAGRKVRKYISSLEDN